MIFTVLFRKLAISATIRIFVKKEIWYILYNFSEWYESIRLEEEDLLFK